jgi:hypothetical protein
LSVFQKSSTSLVVLMPYFSMSARNLPSTVDRHRDDSQCFSKYSKTPTRAPSSPTLFSLESRLTVTVPSLSLKRSLKPFHDVPLQMTSRTASRTGPRRSPSRHESLRSMAFHA